MDIPEDKAAIIMCRPVNPADYGPLKLTLWNALIEAAGVQPNVYPGSTKLPCASCQIQVWVGPRQQQVMAQRDDTLVLCMLCVGQAAQDLPHGSLFGATLGNPWKRTDPDLARHIEERQVAPQRWAQERRREGVEIDVTFVSTDPNATGTLVTCSGCGRTARLQQEVSGGKAAVCPLCLAGK